MNLRTIFNLWFEKINYHDAFNYGNFIPCYNKLEQFINRNIENLNNIEDVNEFTFQIQEDILEIIRNELILSNIDDIYHIILEQLIVKNIFHLNPEPYYFKDILEERLDVVKEMYSNPPILWISNNYPILVRFKDYFE